LWYQAHYAYNPFPMPSGILLRRTTALSAGGFDTSMCMCGDVDFFLRMLERGDLAVTDAFGCEITIHQKQESARLKGNVAVMEEIVAVTERYRALFTDERIYTGIRRQLAAFALGLTFKYWRTGLPEAARAHWKLAWRMGVPPWRAGLAVVRLLGLRAWMTISGQRFMPNSPYASLDGNTTYTKA